MRFGVRAKAVEKVEDVKSRLISALSCVQT